jgi:hypothetical protein
MGSQAPVPMIARLRDLSETEMTASKYVPSTLSVILLWIEFDGYRDFQ